MTFQQQQETYFNLQLKLFRAIYIQNLDMEQVKKLGKQAEDFVKSVPQPNRKHLIMQTGHALIFVIHEIMDNNTKEAIINLIAISGGHILEYETNSLLYEYLKREMWKVLKDC
jgi:hydrogenase maturation factor HypF (carbamoyltransferase family)